LQIRSMGLSLIFNDYQPTSDVLIDVAPSSVYHVACFFM